MRTRSLAFVTLLALAASVGFAQDTPKTTRKAQAKRAPHPSLAPVQDVPGLPRVLLLGDSISMGYTLPTRELLKGVANVHRAPTNCGPTLRGIQEIDRWLGDGKWDVIHFNFGLHDLKYIDEKGQNTSPEKGKVQVPLDDYRRNLETMVEKMKKTKARLIFALTTPVPANEPARKANSDEAYNAVALEVMKKHGVAINDLSAFVRQRQQEKLQLPSNVHFTPEGYKALAGQVAAEIRKALGK